MLTFLETQVATTYIVLFIVVSKHFGTPLELGINLNRADQCKQKKWQNISGVYPDSHLTI